MACKKLEMQFLTDLRNCYRKQRPGSFFYKIKDTPVSAIKSGAMRYTAPQPFDVFLINNGKPMAIEAKAMDSFRPFGIKELRESQVIGLESFHIAGGQSWVVLCVKNRNSDVAIPFYWPEFKKVKRFSKDELVRYATNMGVKGFKGLYSVDSLDLSMELLT